MFRDCTVFNGNVGNWNVSGVTDMNNMFFLATSFNQDIGSWNTGNVTNMNAMLRSATSFNQDIGSWNVSGVSAMNNMFDRASAFNQDIGSWNTSNVFNMNIMFWGASSFNQNISSWNVSNVSIMTFMFFGATAFNQNLGAWQLRLAGVSFDEVFTNSGMSCANYTDTIVGWANYVSNNSNTPINSNMNTQTGRVFATARSGGANFADAGAARTFLTTATPTGAGWTITGDSVVTNC
jgi:surface protein